MAPDFTRLRAALADRYKIERELGQGGMATVYLAQDIKHDRRVAIKVLKPELAAVLGAERFVVEIKTTASLSHPHILPLFDSGSADGFLFYVMPFIDGETLRGKLDRDRQLGIEEAVGIARDVASALHYAHEHGVIHRDIKPENILLHDGRPMVADFGIALAVSAAAGGRMTETGLSLGTPHYMSPEQATAEKEITARSDVYSLGSVLYEMLAGDPPHTGSSAQAIIMKIIADDARPLTELRRSAPAHIAAAVGKAIEKLPADRFASAKEFSDALADPFYGRGTAGVGGAGARVGNSLPPIWMTALIASVALVIGAASTVMFTSTPAPEGTRRLMLDFPAGQEPRLPSNLPPVLAQSPDGSGLLYAGPGTNTRTQFWIRRWDRLLATRLPQSLDEGCCASFSPRGDSVAYLTLPHRLHVLPMGGGLSAVVADSGLTSVSDFGGGISWADDGFIYASGVNGIVRVASGGGQIEEVTRVDARGGDVLQLWPHALPGGRGLLLTLVPGRALGNLDLVSIGVSDLRTGEVRVLLQGLRAVYAPTGHILVVKATGVLWAAPFDARTLQLTGPERELADTLLAVGIAPDLSLAENGTLVYSKGVNVAQRPVWVTRDGQPSEIATDLQGIITNDPRLSPDGRRLLFNVLGDDGRTQLWMKTLAGGPRARLTFDGNANTRPGWRSQTNTISFSSDRVQGGLATRLFEADASGSTRMREIPVPDARQMGAHAWSPDGRWLVLRTDDQEAGNADILAFRPGVDSVALPIAVTDAEELAPTISPDNRWIAYSSNASGRREIYVRPFPDAGTARFQVSTKGGISPAWNPRGGELFYIDAAGNMVAVPVTTGTTFRSGAPQVLFAAARYASNPFFRQYDVAPDGQRFVMLRGEGDALVHVVVVSNFLAELQRLMAAP